ncbi:MFS transporter [Acidiferrimicrobium sp. IK]|uniref:MFS transporter n=1 Tax=Acidiferrimicrobium sp. IK TaxID=2871700 RepID=UPI0021CAEE67|nr:MFS transporter [Acidiferrimicrobium sp. IK]MCU4186084.1 MFS transporter [Acidiferrimicrobium sp. IK]
MPPAASLPTGAGINRRQLAVAYALFVALLASNAPSPLYVVYQQQWHFAALTVTAIFGTYALAVLGSLLLVGRMSDEIGRRKVILPAMVMLGVSASVFLLAENVAWLFVARAVQGVATGALTGGVAAALVELDDDRDPRRASLLNTITFVAGAATGPLLFGVCAQYLPAPTVLPFAVELGLVAISVPLLRSVPETVIRPPGVRWTPRVTRPEVPRQVRRSFAVAGAAVGVAWSVGALYAALGATISRQILHVNSHLAAGGLLFGFNLLGGVSQLSLRHWSPRRSMAAGVGALGAGLALVWAALDAGSVALFAAGSVLTGLGGGITFMGSLALINHIAPTHNRAGMVSAFNMVGYLALALPVMAVGVLTGPLGLLHSTGIFTVLTVVVAAGTLAAVVTHPGDPLAHLTDEELDGLGLSPGAAASGIT